MSDIVGPTRSAKIEWLCSGIGNDASRNFVKKDLESALASLAMLDESQHEDDAPLVVESYDLGLLRMDVAIKHILTIWVRKRDS